MVFHKVVMPFQRVACRACVRACVTTSRTPLPFVIHFLRCIHNTHGGSGSVAMPRLCQARTPTANTLPTMYLLNFLQTHEQTFYKPTSHRLKDGHMVNSPKSSTKFTPLNFGRPILANFHHF